MNIIKNKIKLVIWDLDETFWSGTLSEEGVNYNTENHKIVVELTKRGIVNSICSKNEYDSVKEILSDKNIWNYFVFPEISWNPKGKAVSSIISDMALRAENVLFIDDNLSNLNEVKFENKGISVCEPSIIPQLLNSPYLQGKNDIELTRLSQYKLLEKKRSTKKDRNLSNQEFLFESGVKVNINSVTNENIERVIELIERTNQLNYTKNRQTKDELLRDIAKAENSGVINVIDNYGNYGISGFYLLIDGSLKHFLFSCRTMNMGVENWVYKELGSPKIEIVGDVSTRLSNDINTSHINIKDDSENNIADYFSTKINTNYLVMGGCDLDQVVHYLSGNVDTQFNFVNDQSVSVHVEHSQMIMNKNIEKHSELLNRYVLFKGFDYKYKIHNTNWDVLVYSPLNDYSRGLYRHKKTGVIVAFDAFNINWCKEYDVRDIPQHLKVLTKNDWESLSRDFDFLGPITKEDFKNNIESLLKEFPDRKVLILTGSEIVLSDVRPWEVGMETRHKEMNQVLIELENKFNNLNVVDVRHYCKTQEDHADNIRHYSKSVYYKIAQDIVNKSDLVLENNVKVKINNITQKIKRKVSKLLRML
ncbi:TPA: HAD-IIIC family phosphatase [Vibrio vulnificus]